MKLNKIFLGGTCFGEDWRKKLLPMIQVASFNPLVDDWTPECKVIEDDQKERVCNVHFYLINTPKSIYSLAEVVQSSTLTNKSTVLHVDPSGFSKQELKHMCAIVDLVRANGAIAYIDDDLMRSARLINTAFKTTDFKLTDEECEKIFELSKRPDLNIENCGFGHRYYGLTDDEREVVKEDIEYLETTLKKLCPDLVSFSNFAGKEPNRIRIQASYSPEFSGVHYLSLPSNKD